MPKLNKQDKAYLTVEIDGKTYKIPLARSLKVKEVRKLMRADKLSEADQFDLMYDFMASYLGAEIVDDMTEGDLEQLFTLWTRANNEVGEVSLGES